MKQYKTLICLNGELPSNLSFYEGKFIIAADGAADKLNILGIVADVIIGDFDSIKISNFPKSKRIQIIDQNKTDFVKCLDYAKSLSLESVLVTGIAGGFLDHILNNINISLLNKCDFYAPPIYGRFYEHPVDDVEIKIKPNTKISLMGIPNAVLTTEGLKWELKEKKITFPGENSCLNRSVKDKVKIQILSGALLLMIYDIHQEDFGLM